MSRDANMRPALKTFVGDDTEVVEGKDLRLYFDGKRCIHARYCVTGAPETFLANVEGPWIHPDDTNTEHLAHVAKQCPSGAIQYDRKDGGDEEAAPLVNSVRVWENGPYALHADIQVNGKPDGFRRVLCRCGMSSEKPYCDGTHKGEADAIEPFIATGEPPTRDMTALQDRGGPLEVIPLRDGPLMVAGNLEIMSGTGRGVERTQTCRLCRCGHSGNKPFCDGSHARVGFRTEPEPSPD